MGPAPATSPPAPQAAAGSRELALVRAFPSLAGKLPWISCTRLPTPVHGLPHLGAAFGIPQLWIKRDDASGSLYGGNKPRKLEFLLGDAVARDKSAVMTFGGIGTNHGLATAVYARAHRLRTILLLLRQPVTEKVRRNLLLYAAVGAELHYAPTVPRLVLRGLALLAREAARGTPPRIIPTGGTSPLGTLGYVNAAFELKEQVDAGLLPVPDWIFVAVGSGGTLAGLQLGCKLAALPTRVAGIVVTDIFPPSPARLARLGNRAHALLRREAEDVPEAHLSSSDFTIIRGFVGPGYGAPTAAARTARDELRRLEGIEAETTYTGKCLAGLQNVAGEVPFRGAKILYWHTYSSVEPPEAGNLPDPRDLPRSFQAFFEGPAVSD